MSEPETAWPFDGRVVTQFRDEPLDRPWVFRRMSPGGLYMEPVPQGVSPRTFITPVLPEAVRQLLEPHVDLFGPAPIRHLLGVDSPPRLSARPGKLLSDYLLEMTGLLPTLVERKGGTDITLRMDGVMFNHMPTVHAQLFRREIILSAMGWPLTQPRIVLEITAEDLPGWGFDLATDFARLAGTETYVCDLRVVPVFAKTKPPLTLSDLAKLTDRAARTALFQSLCQLEPSLRTLKSLEAAVQRHYGNRLDERPTLFRDATRRQLRQAFTDFNKERFPTGQVK